MVIMAKSDNSDCIPVISYKLLWSSFLLSFILITTAYSLNLESAPPTNRVNSCHVREVELCLITALSVFQNPNGLPVTEPEIQRQCGLFNESIACFDSYIDLCASRNGMIKAMVNLFARDLIELSYEFCSADSALHKNYTKHAKCLREVQMKYQRQCLTDLQVGLESLHKLPIAKKLSTACCNINRMQDCVLTRLEEKCGDEAADLIVRTIERVAGRVISMTCRNFDPSSEMCMILLPKPGTKPHNGRNTSAVSRVISSLNNAHNAF